MYGSPRFFTLHDTKSDPISSLKAMTAKLRVEMATCLDERMTYEDQADNRLGKANEDMDKWRGIAKDQADEVSSLRGKLVGLTNLSNSLDRRLAEFKVRFDAMCTQI